MPDDPVLLWAPVQLKLSQVCMSSNQRGICLRLDHVAPYTAVKMDPPDCSGPGVHYKGNAAAGIVSHAVWTGTLQMLYHNCEASIQDCLAS